MSEQDKSPIVNVGTRGHCEHNGKPVNEKLEFEQITNNNAWVNKIGINFQEDETGTYPYKYDTANLLFSIFNDAKVYISELSAEHISELEGEVAELKDAKQDLEKEVIHLQEMTEPLKASNNDLLDLVDEASRHLSSANPFWAKLNDAIKTTPAESLANHDDEVIERCAKAIDEMVTVYTKNCDRYKDIEDKESTERNVNKGRAAISCAEVIRALKVEHG